MEKKLAALDLSSAASASPVSKPVSPRNPVHLALSNTNILRGVFKYIPSGYLDYCVEVCPKWSKIAKTFQKSPSSTFDMKEYYFYSDSNEQQRDHDSDDVYQTPEEHPDDSDSSGLEYDDSDSDDDMLTFWYKNYDRIIIEEDIESNDSFYWRVEQSLKQLGGYGKMSTLSASLMLLKRQGDNLVPSPSTLALLKYIKRSRYLRILDLWHRNMPALFLETLLAPEEFAGNPMLKETLESLSILCVNNVEIEALRKKNLSLKILSLTITTNGQEEHDNNNALSLWLTHLSSTLESFNLVGSGYLWSSINLTLEFLTEMKRLKTLHIDRPASLGVDDIIPLLKQLPNLETLLLTFAKSTGLKLKDYNDEPFHEFSHPILRELNIDTEAFKDLDCPPYIYVPKLFPNLRKLSMRVYSRNTFLGCIRNLKDTMIEELELTLQDLPAVTTVETYTPGGSKVPSFNDWKNLRKLTLCGNARPSYHEQGYRTVPENSLMTKVYDLPMETILPRSLTSLELDNVGMFQVGFLLKLLQGLPVLMDLKVTRYSVFDENRKLMELSVFQEKLENYPLPHPYLHLSFLEIKMGY